eukprot:gnl/TRDRNA2_/TRDRNA2_184068_c0_seq1.p1 gnl/TRDRNA2_/TRDRNA2_184068_c0~~gnl/TRDRNA2_/TRDRNA2_184068_c0_seq1.p1  ORF type:complete len:166 (+),score=25.91 gnl/TRDRNA2_/TRDRNA2_184068_c0_seq1:72-569(+)
MTRRMAPCKLLMLGPVAFVAVHAESDASDGWQATAPMRRLESCNQELDRTCRCIMGCSIYGSDSSTCDEDADTYIRLRKKNKNPMGDWRIWTPAVPPGDSCDVIKCAAYCAENELNCIGEFQRTCEDAKANILSDCDVDCSGSRTNAALSAGMAAFLSLAMVFRV